MQLTPPPQVTRGSATDRSWAADAIRQLRDEAEGPDTPMRELRLSAFPGIRFLLKDESVHPSGSLKHRLARALFLHALVNGRLHGRQPAFDASSGSTAISESWFARRLGLVFTAVMPRSTSPGKLDDLRRLGGRCALVDAPADPAIQARALAEAAGGCYLDQFGLARVATDWRGNNNIAQSLLQQCHACGVDDPAWIVCGAGTGGTSATIGRYLRYAGSSAGLCVAEPVGGAFARGWQAMDRNATATAASVIEGIGRPRVEPCFVFELVERVVEVGDLESIAACLLLERLCGRRYGGSSGTNLVAALALAQAMHDRGEAGAIVMLLCDRGDRYAGTLFSGQWLADHDLDPSAALCALVRNVGPGRWFPDASPLPLPRSTRFGPSLA